LIFLLYFNDTFSMKLINFNLQMFSYAQSLYLIVSALEIFLRSHVSENL
jgi:hypothetical protein